MIFHSPQIINVINIFINGQDTNADPKIKDSKVFKIKGSKIDGEKVSRASNASCLHDNGQSHNRTVPSTSLRDCNDSGVDRTRNPGVAIPPLTHNLSAVPPSVTSGMGTVPGVQSYRYRIREIRTNCCLRIHLHNASVCQFSHIVLLSGFWILFILARLLFEKTFWPM